MGPAMLILVLGFEHMSGPINPSHFKSAQNGTFSDVICSVSIIS